MPKEGIVYVATMSMDSFNNQRGQMKPYRGRKILLLPDLGEASKKWRKKAEKILPTGSYQFIEVLEAHATETDRIEGLDIADFLIRDLGNRFEANFMKLHFDADTLLYEDKPAIHYVGDTYTQKFIKDIVEDFDEEYLTVLQQIYLENNPHLR